MPSKAKIGETNDGIILFEDDGKEFCVSNKEQVAKLNPSRTIEQNLSDPNCINIGDESFTLQPPTEIDN